MAKIENFLHIRMVLTYFEVVTGLKLNMGKSEVVPIGYVGNVADFADILCCNIGSFPTTYLGLPLGASFKDLSVWNPILEKIERRLSKRKKLYL